MAPEMNDKVEGAEMESAACVEEWSIPSATRGQQLKAIPNHDYMSQLLNQEPDFSRAQGVYKQI